MSWSPSRSRSADVDASIEYLRRYLREDIPPNARGDGPPKASGIVPTFTSTPIIPNAAPPARELGRGVESIRRPLQYGSRSAGRPPLPQRREESADRDLVSSRRDGPFTQWRRRPDDTSNDLTQRSDAEGEEDDEAYNKHTHPPQRSSSYISNGEVNHRSHGYTNNPNYSSRNDHSSNPNTAGRSSSYGRSESPNRANHATWRKETVVETHRDGWRTTETPSRGTSPVKSTPLLPEVMDTPNPITTQPMEHVFPYAAHSDNVRAMLVYLKNHYALESLEAQRGVETMSPEDVLAVAQCLYVDAYRTVRAARDAAGVGRAGFSDNDPNVECLLRALDTSRGEASQGNLSKGGEALPRTASQEGVSHQRPASQGNAHQRSASQRDASLLEFTHSALHPDTLSVDSAALSLLDPPPEPSGGVLRRPLRALMPLLRRGSTLCKHVDGRRPHLRFFCVADRLAEFRGTSALMPHLTWTHAGAERGALNLVHLIGVYLLTADDAAAFGRLFRRKRGVLVDHAGRPLAKGMCAVWRFETRDLAVAFLTEEDRQLWVGGMMGVVERNRELAKEK